MTIKRDDELRDIVLRILLAAGADERNAKVVAEHLVLANLSGVDTHGIWHVPGYVDAIRDGFIVPTAWPEVKILGASPEAFEFPDLKIEGTKQASGN